jgi:hydroxymethylpyrimidine kinase/phosphomethylpyrimidine kinase
MFGIERVKGKIPVAMTIAGSDSGGGAGIQADLKTFAAIGVHGTTVITSITAQNTRAVRAIVDLESEIIKRQIQTVAEDIEIDAGKTGMLHTKEIIKTVDSEISKYQFPLVVDPVMVAKSGAPLLEPDAMDSLRTHLLPRATVVTPNKFEAEKLTNRTIENLEDAKTAAKEIFEMGPEAVVVKGGHLNLQYATDVLYYKSRYKIFETPRLDVKTTHGTGCSFSAAIAAELAKGKDVPLAVRSAKKFITLAIRFGLNIGKGYGPVNPLVPLYQEGSRYHVLKNVKNAKQMLETSPEIFELVPEVGMNVAMAVPYAESLNDVAAIEGRLVRTVGKVKAVGNVSFGSSSHLARYLLTMTEYDPHKTAAINLKFSEGILSFLEKHGLEISFYDRKEEPEEVKKIEGMTIPWGVKEAIKRVGKVPDVIYHRGEIGKEPMIVIFGEQAYDVAKIAMQLAKEMKES